MMDYKSIGTAVVFLTVKSLIWLGFGGMTMDFM